MNDEKYVFYDQKYESDPLSEVLQLLKLDVRIYHNAKICGQWYLEDQQQKRSTFHIVTLGNCHLDAPGHYCGELNEGDLVIFPDHLPHSLSPIGDQTGEQQHLSFTEGEHLPGTGLLCGEVHFQHRGSQYLLNALPPLLIIRAEKAHPWIKPLLQMIVAENISPGPVSKVVFDKLSELLFTYALREYVNTQPQQSTLLALYGDARLSKALEIIHQHPAAHYSLEQLAMHANMSRTVFAEKFKAISGWTVGQYITWWRMQLAWELLHAGEAIAYVAERVGYQSEAAFSRAFKKLFKLSPGKVRRGEASNDR